MNINVLNLPLPSYEDLLAQRPSFFDEAVNAREAAEMIGKSPAALTQMRCRGNGPAYVKVGKTVMYRRRDVLDWLRVHVKRSAGIAA